MSSLAIKGLSVTFAGTPPTRALREVDLDVTHGSLVAILGPSGCGKTTLLRVVAGLERALAGRVELDGEVLEGDGHHVLPERRRIGLVPQEGALFPHLDVGANIAFGLRRLGRAERSRRVDDLLEMVGLAGLGARRPSELSGGQQQRVALARALAPRPSLVLLDEPFSALDSGLRAQVRGEVLALLRQTATTAVLVTHDQSEALEAADAIAVMNAGRVVQFGTPSQLYHRPVDVWTGSFVGESIVVPGEVYGGVVRSALGALDLATPAPQGPTSVFLRPEQLTRVAAVDPRAVTATVTAVRFRGPEVSVDLLVGSHPLTGRWPSHDVPVVGDELAVAVDGPVLALPLDSTTAAATSTLELPPHEEPLSAVS